MAKKETEVDPRDLIMEHLKTEQRRLPWLAEKTGLSYAHLYFILVKKERDLTDENKKSINDIFNTSF